MLLFACKCVLWFTAYSVAGWIWEVILFCFTDKCLINRGFVVGPLCPIYGAGALLMWGIFDLWLHIHNIFLLFFLGGLLACTMEYTISYGMEKLFHARWWDYTRNRFNINGRVCLLGFTAFGGFCVLIVWLLQPFVVRVTDQIPAPILYSATLVSLFAFGPDLAVTIFQLCKLPQKADALLQGLCARPFAQRLEARSTAFARRHPRLAVLFYGEAARRMGKRIRAAHNEGTPVKEEVFLQK